MSLYYTCSGGGLTMAEATLSCFDKFSERIKADEGFEKQIRESSGSNFNSTLICLCVNSSSEVL